MLSSVIARTIKRSQQSSISNSTLRLRSRGVPELHQQSKQLHLRNQCHRRWNTNTTTTTASSLLSTSSSSSCSNNTNKGGAANAGVVQFNETTWSASSSSSILQLLNATTYTRQGSCYNLTSNGLRDGQKSPAVDPSMAVTPFIYDSQERRSTVSPLLDAQQQQQEQQLQLPQRNVVSSLALGRWPQQQLQQQHQQHHLLQQFRFATSSSSSSSSSSTSAPSETTAEASKTTAAPSSSSSPSSSKRTTISRSTIPTPSSAPPINSLKDKLVPRPMAMLKQFSDWAIYLGRTILIGLFVRLPKATWHYIQNPSDFKAQYQRLKQVAKDEAHHYWVGTKLLVADVRTARDLTRKTLNGNALTRRERNQLLRTVADLFRLIPFSMFLLIPLAEFALPFALKIFPNLLPSTFQDSLKAEENMKRELQSRLAMAQFFQETLEELAKEQKRKARKARKDSVPTAPTTTTSDSSSSSSSSSTNDSSSSSSLLHLQEDSAASMLDFLQKARNGEMLESSVIIRYAKYFQDDLTLDNMPRMQLMNMCKYMNIAPYGNDSFLRFQLRHRIRILKEDDQRILWEGIESLTKMELREACQERGMRSTGLSKEAYKYALQQWLDLSVQKNVPISLLIMSRSFFLREDIFHPPDSSSRTAATAATTTEAVASTPTTTVASEKVSIPTTQEFITTTAASSADPDRLTSTSTITSTTTDASSTASSPPPTKPTLGDSSVAGIADAISGLDKDIVSSVILEVATAKEKLSDPEIRKLKLQVLSQQNELIKQEKADQEQANLAKKKEKGQQVAAAAAAAAATAGAEYTSEQQQQQQASASLSTESGILNAEVKKDVSPPPSVTTKPIIPEVVEKTEPEEEDQSMDLSTNEMDALRQLVSEDPVSSERAQLQQIKAAMTKKHDVDEEEEEPIVAMGVDAPKVTASTMGEAETVSTSVEPKPAMTPDETDRMVAETIESLDTMAATSSDSTTMTTTSTTMTADTKADVVEEDDAYHLEEEMIADDPIVARLKKRIESMLDKIEVQLSDVHLKIGDKLHMLDKDKDGILTQQEVAGVLQQVLKREITSEEANEIAGEMDENSDGVLTVEELMRWIDEHKLVKFVEEGRDADMDRVMEEVQTPTSPADANNDSINSNGKVKDNNTT